MRPCERRFATPFQGLARKCPRARNSESRPCARARRCRAAGREGRTSWMKSAGRGLRFLPRGSGRARTLVRRRPSRHSDRAVDARARFTGAEPCARRGGATVAWMSLGAAASAEAMVKLLSAKNLALLHLIATRRPDSVRALAKLTRRKESNLSRTLKKLREAGIVDFEQGARRMRAPRLVARRVTLDLDLVGPGRVGEGGNILTYTALRATGLRFQARWL